jgi:hypothetical protein
MWAKLLSNIALPVLGGLAKWALSKLPIERLIAWLLNMWLKRITPENMGRALKSGRHIGELVTLVADILEDRQVTAKEATDARVKIMSLKEDLIGKYARGERAKELERELNGAN